MRIAVSGAAGRMGKRILALAHENADIEISGALEESGHPALGKDAGEIAGIGQIGIAVSDSLKEVLENCDVLIDFSAASASVSYAEAAAAAGKAVVIGTTGFSEDQKQRIRQAAASTRCLIAPNMSLGVNLLFSLVGQVAKALGDAYDVEIVETHHRMKKDAPSGTALKLAEEIAKALKRDLTSDMVCGRQGLIGERKPGEIGVLAVRGGDIVGEHTVSFITGGERIELTHRAHSRDAFAGGALQGASWLIAMPNGIYDMQDVLGLKVYK